MRGHAADRCVLDPQAEPWSPRRLVRTCVASMVASRSFGPLMAAEVQSRDFYAARRRAFVADGQAYNWSIQRGYFPDFVPIVDLLHVVCYLFKAAQAVEAETERWPLYLRWLRSCWQGRAAEVVVQMERYQERWDVRRRGRNWPRPIRVGCWRRRCRI